MITARERAVLAKDYGKLGKRVLHEPRSRQRRARPAARGLGIAEIDGVIVGKGAIEDHVVQAALTGSKDFWHAGNCGRERAVLAKDTHAARPFAHQEAAIGKECERPWMSEALGKSLDREAAR